MRNKINIQYAMFTPQKLFISAVIIRCISETLRAEKVTVPCEINVLVTDDRGIQGINNAVRQIDKPTDVLSFPMFELTAGSPPEDWTDYIDPETGLCPLGDMVISLERAIAQAKEFGHRTRREIGYLTIHSMLHLLGYDHMDDGDEKRLMRSREEAIADIIPRMHRD